MRDIDVKMARIFIVDNNDSSGREMKVFSESNDQVFKIRRNVDKAGKFMVPPVASHPVPIKVLSQDSRCQTVPTPGILNTDTSSLDLEMYDSENLEIPGKN